MKSNVRALFQTACVALALIFPGLPAHAQALPSAPYRLRPAQAVDDTQLKQVIFFGRHSVRAPVADNSVLNNFSAQPFPSFPVATGLLTPNGAALETILGGYYRLWLTKEGC